MATRKSKRIFSLFAALALGDFLAQRREQEGILLLAQMRYGLAFPVSPQLLFETRYAIIKGFGREHILARAVAGALAPQVGCGSTQEFSATSTAFDIRLDGAQGGDIGPALGLDESVSRIWPASLSANLGIKRTVEASH